MDSNDIKGPDKSIFDVILRIKQQPGIFLDGDRSLKRLRSFLVGYECGLGCAKLYLRNKESFDQFNEWVATELGFRESTSGWCNMITEKAGSDSEAYSLFFVMIERFCREKGIHL